MRHYRSFSDSSYTSLQTAQEPKHHQNPECLHAAPTSVSPSVVIEKAQVQKCLLGIPDNLPHAASLQFKACLPQHRVPLTRSNLGFGFYFFFLPLADSTVKTFTLSSETDFSGSHLSSFVVAPFVFLLLTTTTGLSNFPLGKTSFNLFSKFQPSHYTA